MNLKTTKSFIFKKTAEVGFLTIVSRLLGMIREIVQGYYLGINANSDAFITAFRIPNLLRKLFESNGLTAAFVPHTVKMLHDGRKAEVNQFLTVLLVVLELVLMIFCALVWIFPERAILMTAPGFSLDQVALTVPIAQIMFPVILGFAGFSTLSTALHAVNHFFVPALGATIFNLVYLAGLLTCWYGNFSILVMAWFVLLAGVAKFLLIIVACFWQGFSFAFPRHEIIPDLIIIFKRIIPCLVTFGALEINSFMDIRLGSYLPRGSVTMLYLTHRFYMLPYSIFAVSLGTVLLSHFSDSVLKNPRRITFYIFECSKLAIWFAIPVTIFMVCMSKSFFNPAMFKGRATPELIELSAKILAIMICAFPFQMINKIMFKALLSRNDTTSSMLVVLCAMAITTIFNYSLVGSIGAHAMAIGTVLCAVIKMLLLMGLLHIKHGIVWPYMSFFVFLRGYLIQFFSGVCFFSFLYATLTQIIDKMSCSNYVVQGQIGYWALVLFVFTTTLVFSWRTYKYFGLKLYLMPHHSN